MSNLNEENKELKAKLARLLAEHDKITDQLAKAQEIATELKKQLDEKKHSEQLGAWAIDRALELAKIDTETPWEPTDIAACAEEFCNWIMKSSAKPNLKLAD